MDSSALIAVVGAVSALVGVFGKTYIDKLKEDNTSSNGKRQDFTVVVEQMKFLIQRGEDKIDEQESQMKLLYEENAALKIMFTELRILLDSISIDPEVINKINSIYEKLKDK